MVQYTQGNLLEAEVAAVVNTVNTVGVMGKGIALMFKERFPSNFKAYKSACKSGEVEVGQMFITQSDELSGPRWIINFPTKEHWRYPTQIEWVETGLVALRVFILENNITSIALPPLGCGNGGLDWLKVRALIETALADLPNTQVIVFEPTQRYQNVAKKQGVEKLTPARAMICELIRRYAILGIPCTLLEVQKMAWFLERFIVREGLNNELDLRFQANRYGPYADRLKHLLNHLDGSYLQCDKRLADASAMDDIRFKEVKRDKIAIYLKTEAKEYRTAFQALLDLIDGFQSPLGMEALATVDWLIQRESCAAEVSSLREGLARWPHGEVAARRKLGLFTDALLRDSLQRLQATQLV